jgi:hypothetical protein
MINMRISWWLEKNQTFSETQYGFRRNKSCTHDVTILTIGIVKAFEERNTVSVVFLDIKSAYNFHYGTLMDRLKEVDFSGNLLVFIINLVSSRKLEENHGWLDLELKPKINQNCNTSNMQMI